uniref:TlpA family protein disulfide reductase n=1 Tax=Pedobacter schmidteae TaxID=2201271 RepID=UPI000EB0E060|nr:TlpA disulfide reductase family protein [Pedobacter schmidteae]
MKTRILAIVLALHVTISLAQKIKPLTVGDKVPDVVFKTMLNHKTPSGKLSDFKGKALIIDMWFRQCGACVDAMPHLDSIQNTFKDELQVLLVTWQTKKEIEGFWKERLPVQGLKFTQAVEDTVVKALFPAVGYPHQIWIDKNGIVKSINDGRQTTKANVNRLIAGEAINIAIKKDELDPSVSKASIPMAGIRYDENKGKILHYSYLSEFRPELSGASGYDRQENGTVRFRFLNEHYAQLYHIAYAGSISVPYDRKNRIIRNDTNPIKHAYDNVNFSNYFCYDLIFKEKAGVLFSQYMIEDLDRYLGFKSHEEIRKIKTLIIRPNGKGKRYKDKLEPNKRPYTEYGKFKNGNLVLLNNGWIDFVNLIAMESPEIPTVFEFPGEKYINLKITWNSDNLPAMNEELKNYDVEAIIENRDTKVIVLENRLY